MQCCKCSWPCSAFAQALRAQVEDVLSHSGRRHLVSQCCSPSPPPHATEVLCAWRSGQRWQAQRGMGLPKVLVALWRELLCVGHPVSLRVSPEVGHPPRHRPTLVVAPCWLAISMKGGHGRIGRPSVPSLSVKRASWLATSCQGAYTYFGCSLPFSGLGPPTAVALMSGMMGEQPAAAALGLAPVLFARTMHILKGHGHGPRIASSAVGSRSRQGILGRVHGLRPRRPAVEGTKHSWS